MKWSEFLSHYYTAVHADVVKTKKHVRRLNRAFSKKHQGIIERLCEILHCCHLFFGGKLHTVLLNMVNKSFSTFRVLLVQIDPSLMFTVFSSSPCQNELATFRQQKNNIQISFSLLFCIFMLIKTICLLSVKIFLLKNNKYTFNLQPR